MPMQLGILPFMLPLMKGEIFNNMKENRLLNMIQFIKSFELDYQDLTEVEAIFLCCYFAERMELMASKLNETGAILCEVATAANAVHTRSFEMVEYSPYVSYASDENGAPKAFRVNKFEFLPSSLNEKGLAFVQSWFQPTRNDRTGWLGVVELLLSFHLDFPVRIKGDYPKNVTVFLNK